MPLHRGLPPLGRAHEAAGAFADEEDDDEDDDDELVEELDDVDEVEDESLLDDSDFLLEESPPVALAALSALSPGFSPSLAPLPERESLR